MAYDYAAAFPIPMAALPQRLKELLTPEGLTPDARIVVAARQDLGRDTGRREFLQMIMATTPSDTPEPQACLREASNGLVSFSTPVADEAGDLSDLSFSVSGLDYIVAAWGDNSFYSYHLAEKVWMTLGLTGRCVGNELQRLVYDDLSAPEHAVAEGEVSTEYEWTLKRDVTWTMSNRHLRRYLWMRGAGALRVFFYEVLLPDHEVLRAAMDGKPHTVLKPAGEWCEADLREHQGGLLLQVWATVRAVTPELCPEIIVDGLDWPGWGPMTADEANALVAYTPVYLNDRFLERYEQDVAYDTVPILVGGERWHCSPSYRGQWSFTECVRVGRNLIRVPMREIYKPKPDHEIVHAHRHALAPDVVARMDEEVEHIAAKTQRLLDAFLAAGDGLARLGRSVGLEWAAMDLTKISRVRLQAEGWRDYPQLSRLAQVAPLDMSQQAFLARCKSLHEFHQVIPNGLLKRLLEAGGVPANKIANRGSLTLLQVLLNMVQRLNRDQERLSAFASAQEPGDWDQRNAGVAALFVTNDLRIADAHEVTGKLGRLRDLGFDMAQLNTGYGTALDFVFDRVIDAFALIAQEIQALAER